MPSSRPRKGQPRIRATPDEMAQTRLRDAQAVELAVAGLSYAKIADQLGFADKSVAWRAVHRALERNEAPKVGEYRELENARLDRLQAAWWAAAITDRDPKAAMIIIRIFERRARLNGLDQQVSRDASALADALLADPTARAERLIALRDELAERRRQRDAETG